MSQKLIQLSTDDWLDRRHKEVLSHIREKYGNTTQILVSNEELCELAAVCAKFPRYSDPHKAREELHSSAVDEVADVMIILDHIINIFQLEDAEIRTRIEGKIARIGRWLSSNNGQEQTTVDREVSSSPCSGCIHVGNFQNLKPGHRCHTCVNSNWTLYETQGANPITPNQIERVPEDADGDDS